VARCIIVPAAEPWATPALVAQMRPGGRMVIPFGDRTVVFITNTSDGGVTRPDIFSVAVLPLARTFRVSIRPACVEDR
jgi:protein-L-isoaspartate O-methyltransferase